MILRSRRCAKERATGRRSFDSADASIGHAAVRGAIIGYFVVLALVSALIFTTAGVGLGTALAVGAYVGRWAAWASSYLG